MKAEIKYKGALKLSAIGDALGWMTEFESSRNGVQNKFGQSTIDKFHNWEKTVGGRFNGYIDYLKSGSYSDDTQLLLSVARSIKPNGKVDNVYFSKNELPAWLLYSRGAGRTIKNAAQKIERKSAKWNSNFFTFKAGNATIDYRESGANGAAMRIMPIALANFRDIETIKEEVFANSIVTHGHSRAILGAMLYAYAIDLILPINFEDFNSESLIVQIGQNFQQKFSLPFISKNEYASWIYEWNKKSNESFIEQYNKTLDETQEQLRLIYKGVAGNYPPEKVLKELGCLAKETKGSGVATVLAGLYLTCKFHNKPIEGIVYAVNFLSSDTDSIAAFTGGLLGALHGQSIIPDKWKTVQDLDYLDFISKKLLAISEDKHFPDQNKEIQAKFRNFKLEKDDFKLNEKVTYNPLGIGKIVKIDRQQPLTKGKYNLIIDIEFEIGQTCRFCKLLNGTIPQSEDLTEAIALIKEKVNPSKQNELIDKIKRMNNKEANDLITEILKSIA
jgi:ADP-ribosylglycohydrolase